MNLYELIGDLGAILVGLLAGAIVVVALNEVLPRLAELLR